MTEVRDIFEKEKEADIPDPDEVPIKDRKLITQPYDLVIDSLLEQINDNIIFLRPKSNRPHFQRQYVWNDSLASKLIESILLKVPIPPCYLSQNDEFELDVIDGQQRLFSIYRFIDNQFRLTSLEVLKEFNGVRFYELPPKTQRQLKTHTMRCVLITNESHPEIKFDVFQRLNTNTVPLNAQELRNCVYRGALNSMLLEASLHEPWLRILGRKSPDKRLRDEELILRFFAFDLHGLESYRTPQKQWLNETAKAGRHYSDQEIDDLMERWEHTIEVCLVLFTPKECFRRYGSKAVNRALFDLVTFSAKSLSLKTASSIRNEFRSTYRKLAKNLEFEDLISRSVDHKSRTLRRFEIWQSEFDGLI